MGNGGILWIWMTITISVVHLSPLVFDFDHMNEKSPDSFQKLKFSVPGLRTEIRDRFLSTLIFQQFLDIQCRFEQNWSSQPRESFSRPR